MDDCTYLYFKTRGKWAYEGRGLFPTPPETGWHEVDRAAIMEANDGHMPGLCDGYDARDLIVVVIPDEACEASTTWPRLLKPTEGAASAS